MRDFYSGQYPPKHIRAYWDKECTPCHAEEKRIDPIDMAEYTYSELEEHYKTQDFDEKAVQRYWTQECAFIEISPLIFPQAAVNPEEMPPLNLSGGGHDRIIEKGSKKGKGKGKPCEVNRRSEGKKGGTKGTAAPRL